jgi:hypothetical protein
MQVDDNTIPLLDVLVMKRGPKLDTKVYRKLTYTGRYLHFKSNHRHHVKRKEVQSLINTANVVCQNQMDFDKDIKNIRYDLLNEYPEKLVTSILKSSRSSHHSSGTTY